jgi:hypothetical protein
MPTTKRRMPRILDGYEPVAVLWRGANAPYPSEQSARWALRVHRTELAAASALALHGGRLLVQPELFVRVVERAALDAAQRKAKDGA